MRCGWDGFGSIEGTERCWHLRHWCCRSCCRSAMCICTGWRRARPPRSLTPLLSLTRIRRRRRQFRPTLTITARSARQFSWHRAHSRQRRRNCLSLRISSESSIASMPHDRSLSLRGSLSDRALRPWPEAAVLLIFLVAARSVLCAGQEFKATRRVFPKRPAIRCDSKAACVRAFQKSIAW